MTKNKLKSPHPSVMFKGDKASGKTYLSRIVEAIRDLQSGSLERLAQSGAEDGQALIWDSEIGSWVPGIPAFAHNSLSDLQGGGAFAHNSLSDLQGGGADEYFHLNEEAYNSVSSFWGANSWDGTELALNGSLYLKDANENIRIGLLCLSNPTGRNYNIAEGYAAAQNATGNDGVYLGRYAGRNALNGANISVGRTAGYYAKGSSVCIGASSGYYANSNCLAIGSNCLNGVSGGGENKQCSAVGNGTMQYIDGGMYLDAFGYQALQYCTGSAVASFGFYAMQNAYGDTAGTNRSISYTAAFGPRAGQAQKGSNNTYIGADAGRYNIGNYVMLSGREAGYNNQGSYDVISGFRAGYNNTGDHCVLLGTTVGFGNTRSKTLMIDCTATDFPLIYGEFDTNYLRINGDFCVTGSISSDGVLGISGTFTAGGGETITVTNGLITDIS